MLQGALAFLGNQSFFLLRTLALYRQIEVATPRKTVVFLLTFC